MIPVKIQCGCGQKYSLEVQLVGGRMPSAVACPVCGIDGTAAANDVITQTLALQPPPPPPAPAPTRLRPASAPPPAVAAQPPASAPDPLAVAASRLGIKHDSNDWGPGGKGDNWKWWYYVLAGVCIAGYSIWQAYDQQRIKPLGELFLAVFCICIGVWDFMRKRKRRAQG